MYDVIIVGGGPSGASAGRRAGKLGLKTLLLEKEKFPRYKPCGGALSEHAMSYLDFELPQNILSGKLQGQRSSSETNISRHTRIIGYLHLSLGISLTISFLKKQKKQGLKSIQGKKLCAAGKCLIVLKWIQSRVHTGQNLP